MRNKNLRDLILLSLTTAIYMLFGALVFQSLESRHDNAISLQNLTESLKQDLMFRFNASKVEVEEILNRTWEILHLQEQETQKAEWSFYSSLYFVGSVITTIGYGHVSPHTTAGRLFCMLFATIGIPLNLLTLKALGDGINKMMSRIIFLVERKFLKREPKQLKIKLMLFSAVLMILELLIGGVLYSSTENWDYLTSVYYCYIVFTTIGFGDLVPNQGRAPTDNFLIMLVFLRAGLLIIGLSTLSSLLSSVVSAAEDIYAALPKCFRKNKKRVAPVPSQADKQSRVENHLDARGTDSLGPTPLPMVENSLQAS